MNIIHRWMYKCYVWLLSRARWNSWTISYVIATLSSSFFFCDPLWVSIKKWLVLPAMTVKSVGLKPSKQWAAVMIHRWPITDPPHRCALYRCLNETCQGHAPGLELLPPNILERDGFLPQSKLSKEEETIKWENINELNRNWNIF